MASQLEKQLRHLCARSNMGSAGTKAARHANLMLAASDLAAMNIKIHWRGLTKKHTKKLVKRWRERGNTDGTIINRLSAMRWWLDVLPGCDKSAVEPNAAYGLTRDRYSYVDQSSTLTDDVLALVDGPYAAYIRCSLRLQYWLGLRVKESILFCPSRDVMRRPDGTPYAVGLQKGTKGGRPRAYAIVFDEAIAAIHDAHALVGASNMLPPINLHARTTSPLRGRQLLYRDYRRAYYDCMQRIGLVRKGRGTSHSLRHAYLNKRVLMIMGQESPVRGGVYTTYDEIQALRKAYRIAAEEAGHGREAVTQSYCGRIPKQASGQGETTD